MATYKTTFERGITKYQVEFIGKRFLLPGTELHQWGFIEGEKYLAYRMKISGRIIIQGRYQQDFTGKVKTKNLEFGVKFCSKYFKYMTN